MAKIRFSRIISFRVFRLKLFMGLLILYTISLLLYNKYNYQNMILNRKMCYQYNNNQNSGERLEDILYAKYQPKEGRSIFFLMTSCSNKGIMSLTVR